MTYYTLAVLLDGPSHGYAVLDRVKEMTGGKVSLTTGTLYGTLDRLVDEGLIQRAGSEIVRGRARQYFEITDKGSGAVQLEAERLAQAAKAVQKAMRARAGRQKVGARRSTGGPRLRRVCPTGPRRSREHGGAGGPRRLASACVPLLREAYPAWYRVAFGDDLVAVLEESHAGERRPSARECASLVVAGLGRRVAAARSDKAGAVYAFALTLECLGALTLVSDRDQARDRPLVEPSVSSFATTEPRVSDWRLPASSVGAGRLPAAAPCAGGRARSGGDPRLGASRDAGDRLGSRR